SQSVQAAQAQQIATQITAEFANVTQQSADKSLLDAQNKQAQTAQTQLLQAQTQAAVSAFLALNPTIDASGIAAAVAAGRISPLIGQLAAAEAQARSATQALAEFNTLQGLRAQSARELTGAESERADIQNRRSAAARDEADSIRQTGAAAAQAR